MKLSDADHQSSTVLPIQTASGTPGCTRRCQGLKLELPAWNVTTDYAFLLQCIMPWKLSQGYSCSEDAVRAHDFHQDSQSKADSATMECATFTMNCAIFCRLNHLFVDTTWQSHFET